MTFIENIEKAIEIGLVKNRFNKFELLISDIENNLVVENIDEVISISKKIVELINENDSYSNKEISELINLIN